MLSFWQVWLLGVKHQIMIVSFLTKIECNQSKERVKWKSSATQVGGGNAGVIGGGTWGCLSIVWLRLDPKSPVTVLMVTQLKINKILKIEKKRKKKKKNFFLLLFFGGGVTPGIPWNYSWLMHSGINPGSAQGTIWNAGTQTQVSRVQGKRPTRCTIAPAPENG